jgi:hypothetical protein
VAARPGEQERWGSIFPQQAASRFSVQPRPGVMAASEQPEAWRGEAQVRPSAQPEASPAVWRREAAHEAVLREAVLRGTVVPRVAPVRHGAVPDERVQLSEQDLSAALPSWKALLSASSPVRFRWMALLARVAPAPIARSTALSSVARA